MATATDVLNAMESAINTLYPAIPVRQRRHEPGAGRDATAGNRAGDPVPGFLLVLDELETVEKGTFEAVVLTYHVKVFYLKNMPPGAWDEDEDTRTKREAILDALYKPRLTGVSSVYHVGTRAGPPYDGVLGKTQSASSWVFEVTAWRPRSS